MICRLYGIIYITFVIKHTVFKDFDSVQLFGTSIRNSVSAKSGLLEQMKEQFEVFFARGLVNRSVFPALGFSLFADTCFTLSLTINHVHFIL